MVCHHIECGFQCIEDFVAVGYGLAEGQVVLLVMWIYLESLFLFVYWETEVILRPSNFFSGTR
jgi:hypothetical protein